MSWIKRFIWWKCLFWIALGAGVGAAASLALPETGPGSGKRISPEEFVALFKYPVLTDGEKVSNISVYPAHDGVELLTFHLSGPKSSAYIYGRRPFVTVKSLQQMEREIANRADQTFYRSVRSFVGGRKPAIVELREKEKDAHMPAFQEWPTAGAFLADARAANPGLKITSAWWTDRSIQRDLGAVGGAIVIGTLCSLTLARRTVDEQAAHELMSTAAAESALPSAPAGPSEEDLRRVRELDEALARNLTSGNLPADAVESNAAAADVDSAGQASTPAIAKLSDAPLEAPVEMTKEDKEFAGAFYPTERRNKPKPERGGFSLVELLVVIGILAILMGILLPVLSRARRSADAIACAANLRSIAQGFTMYLQANQNTFPASYMYINQALSGPTVGQTSPASGYIHWSSYLYGDGAVPQSAFTCPSMDRGGLPPTNTPPENMNAGQTCPNPAIVDQQAPRLAYTANEALCPRNKFNTGFQAAIRTYRFVKANEVGDSSGTILATEMIDNGNMISYGDSNSGYIMSHRPIQGFCNDSSPDIYLLPIGAGFRPCKKTDIDADPLSATSSNSRLDLVGRNHGPKQGYPDRRLSNFAYVDGHVETKSVYDTVEPFQWGSRFFSLVPNDDEQPQ